MFGKARLQKCLKEFYKEGRIDYTMPPLVRLDSGNAVGSVKNGDSLFFCCRRGDREVQLTEAFVDPAFSHFPVETMPDLTVVTLVQFHEKFANLPTMFAILRPLANTSVRLAYVKQRLRSPKRRRMRPFSTMVEASYLMIRSNGSLFRVPTPLSSYLNRRPVQRR